MFGQYFEGKDLTQAINDLSKSEHYMISFDKIDPSLVFFHEGDGQMFSIITNKKPQDDEYKKFLQLKNCQKIGKEADIVNLANYKDYKQIDFLKELKDILNIDNPVTIKEKNEKIKKLKKDEKYELLSLEEITNNYVFTPDNFVKMILILIRIRSNVPVIMMGETGCGKTSLIKKLSEMLNNGSSQKMKTLNIHAGITENEIIEFLEKQVIKEANKLEAKEKKIKEENNKR